MPRYDFRAQRLFLALPMREGTEITLDGPQAHYLLTVLRMQAGDALIVFNGSDGEWRATISEVHKKRCVLRLDEQLRSQPAAGDLTYAFAPLKSARLDYLVQKATEMGATRLQPVLTRRTQAPKLNAERMRANIIEAAEQCGVLALPELLPETRFETFLAERAKGGGVLVFCDEDQAVTDPLAALAAARPLPITLLVGPEGGFDEAERSALLDLPHVVRLSLGPRILRADTAAVAALALVQAALGDWRR